MNYYKLKYMVFFSIVALIATTVTSFFVYAINYTSNHDIDEVHVFMQKETGNGLDAYYGYWQYDGNPVQINYDMDLFYLPSSPITTTDFLEASTDIEYKMFFGMITNHFTDSDSVGRNGCLAGEDLHGSFIGPNTNATKATTVFTCRTTSYGNEIWTVTGN